MTKPVAAPKAADPHARKTVLTNRKARHEYHILDTLEAGMSLVGTEVKSIRLGQASIAESFARIENNEVWLHNMHVNPYEHGTQWNAEPRRPRKLLLHRAEIERLRASMDQKGYALIPLSLFFQHGFAKLELGLGKGKQLFDKRDDLAKRDVARDLARELSSR